MKNKITNNAWLIWLIAALFYSIEYFQRVSPSVMATPLMQTFHISATTLGFIISLYLYAYAAAQIPVGILLDRDGPRLWLSIACATIAIGCLLFAITKILFLLAIARILIGFGSAFAFIGVLKLSGNWFSKDKYPLIVGLTNTLGVIGAIGGEAPLAKLVEYIGWQNSIIITSAIALIISYLLWLIVRDQPKSIKKLSYQSMRVKCILKKILTHQQTWLTAIYAGLMVAPIIAFAELWAVPFLGQAEHISNFNAASLNTAIFIGIAIGGPINGWLGSILQKPKLIMLIGNIIAMLSLLVIIFINAITEWMMLTLLFIFGFSTSSMLFSFTLNKTRHPLAYNATVVAFTNMMIMLIGAVYQPLIGKLLDIETQLKHYNLLDYQHALLILPATLLVSFILGLIIKLPVLNKPQ